MDVEALQVPVSGVLGAAAELGAGLTAAQWTVLVCAAAALGIGLVLVLGGRRRLGSPTPRARLVLAWLVLALCPVFLVFLFFPDSTINGEFGWGTASGALAAYLVVWGIGIRQTLQAEDLEVREKEVVKRENTVASMAGEHAEPLSSGDVELYYLVDRPRRSIGLVPGGLSQVTFADVWVNSENTNMQMARYFDRSVSGVIRYLGGRHDAAGEVVEDVIGSALAARMEGRRSVPLGTVLDTEPGELAESHNVRRLLHVAAVAGEFGCGYSPATDIGNCVRSTLRCAEKLAQGTAGIRSVLLPLLGSGTAKGELDSIARAVLDAAVDHLECHPNARITKVFVMTHTDTELARCRVVLDEDERVQAGRAVKRATLRATALSA
ncbi:macro domain-containing protein [Geodermatophilus sp. URMC 62]|uniref:macro domain-containing protein n=1 Tax=Geodermatophilus sp. URMC 62 TaxID=3423414 RepID=UPI00406D1C0F